MISLFGLSFLLFILLLSSGTKFRVSHVICEFNFGVICGLIDNASYGEKFIIFKSCSFYNSDKVFSRVHSLI